MCIVHTSTNNMVSQIQYKTKSKGIEFLRKKNHFLNLCRSPLIFQTMSSVSLKSLSFKYQRITTLSSKDIR